MLLGSKYRNTNSKHFSVYLLSCCAKNDNWLINKSLYNFLNILRFVLLKTVLETLSKEIIWLTTEIKHFLLFSKKMPRIGILIQYQAIFCALDLDIFPSSIGIFFPAFLSCIFSFFFFRDRDSNQTKR